MSLLKFLKGIFLPKKESETPVTIVKPEDYPPLVNKVQKPVKKEVVLEAPIETLPIEQPIEVKPTEQPIEATMTPEETPVTPQEKPTKTVKDIKSKSNKPDVAPKPKTKSKPKPKPKPKDGDAK
jgi:hypothetical protein